MRVLKSQRMIEGDETYIDVYLMLLESPIPSLDTQPTMSSKEIRECAPIAAKIAEVDCPPVGSVEFALEDNQYDVMRDRLDKWIWPNGKKGIAAFLADFDSAEKISAEDWVERKKAH
jgi:hypothetical protein